MPSALRLYAHPQARVRARIARLLGRTQLETLAAYPEAAALERELAALGWDDPDAALVAAFDRVVALLEGTPRRVVEADRRRFELRNLAVLLRGVEHAAPWSEIEPLLLPVGALGPGPRAEALLRASSLADAVARLDPEPFGEPLRRAVRGTGAAAVDRFRLELLAERGVYEAAWAAVGELDGDDRRGAERVLGTRLDCVNLIRAMRLRESHGLAPDEVLAQAIRGGLHIGAAERRVLAHEPREHWAALLARTPYAAALAAAATGPALELALARILAREANRALVGSPFQLGLLLGYLVLAELQAADLRRLLAGKRMGRPEAWLRGGLIAARAA